MMHMLIKVGVAILGLILALWILKNALGLIVGLALAAVLYMGATKMLEKK